jgi:hypothetical protein
MVVPVDATLAARNIRAHELAHATWTPTRSPASICKANGVTHDALQRAEDCRIGYGLIDSDVPGYGLGTLTDEDVARLEKDGRQLLADHGDAIRDSIAKRLSFQTVSMAMTVDRARLIDLADKLGGEPMRSLVEHVAEAAEATLFPRGRYRHQQALRRARSGAGPKVSAAVPFKRTIALARLLDRLFPPERAPSAGRSKPTPRSGQGEWGHLTIEEPPRSVVARLAKLRTVRRPSDEGTTIRRLDRLLVDGRVFASKRHLPGGTVLIDASGSMGWSPEDMLKCLEAAPAAVIALYSGRGSKGVLRVVAKDGRMIAPDLVVPPCGGGNIVDGPALEWLASQAEPRIWISDGVVTGVNDVEYAALSAEAQRVQMTGRIRRLDNLGAATEHFSHLSGSRNTRIS